MSVISVMCREIQTDGGFEFRVPSDRFTQFHNLDCEQFWYSQDGHLIADPLAPHTLIDPVISVSSDRLFTSRCVNLNHQIICDADDRFKLETAFRVWRETTTTPDSMWNETAVTPNSNILTSSVTPSLQHPDQLWLHLVIIIISIIIFLLVLTCFMLRKRIFRCFQRAASCIFQPNDSEERDPKSDDYSLIQVESDDPHSLQEFE